MIVVYYRLLERVVVVWRLSDSLQRPWDLKRAWKEERRDL
jgi:hypothetical protein